MLSACVMSDMYEEEEQHIYRTYMPSRQGTISGMSSVEKQRRIIIDLDDLDLAQINLTNLAMLQPTPQAPPQSPVAKVWEDREESHATS